MLLLIHGVSNICMCYHYCTRHKSSQHMIDRINLDFLIYLQTLFIFNLSNLSKDYCTLFSLMVESRVASKLTIYFHILDKTHLTPFQKLCLDSGSPTFLKRGSVVCMYHQFHEEGPKFPNYIEKFIIINRGSHLDSQAFQIGDTSHQIQNQEANICAHCQLIRCS